MTKLTDGKRTVEIRMTIWQETGYAPDWENDFFDVGLLPMTEDGAYIVPDVGYCIDQALEWLQEDANNTVFINE